MVIDLIDDLDVQPFLAAQAHHGACAAEQPVNGHGNVHAQQPQAKIAAQKVGAHNAAQEHGGHAHDHGIAHIPGAAQGVGQGKGKRPERDGGDVEAVQHNARQPVHVIAEIEHADELRFDQIRCRRHFTKWYKSN